MKRLQSIFSAAVAALALTGLSLPAHADYPDKPVKLIVPYSPGGPADLLARVVAQKLSTSMGQSFVIENKPGAGLVVGAEAAAKSAPDGYTLFLAASSMLMDSGGGARRTPEDNLKDFAPISLIGSLPLVAVVNPSLPVQNARDLMEYARKRPGEVNFGSSGAGSLTALAGEIFNTMGGVKMVHIPYRGINEAMADLIAGRVQVAFAGAPIALPHVKTGKVKAIAVTSLTRTSGAPELPTVADSAGMTGFEVNPWYGFVAPTGTPPAVLNRLHVEINKILQQADVKERWIQWGAEPVGSKSPAEFATLMRNETNRWARMRAEGKVKMD
jgi:tripartite-type tricarboxylate transporter receptor subunit TctC